MAQTRAMAELARLGLSPGPWMKFKPGKKIRRRGKPRNGQHKGHRCSATTRSGKKKG